MTTVAVGCIDLAEEVKALERLCQDTRARVEQGLVLLRRVSQLGAAVSRQATGDIEGYLVARMVLDVKADWQVDPRALLWERDTRCARLDCVDLRSGANTRVEQDTRGGHDTSGENDGTSSLQVDDLTALRILNFNTSDGRVVADGTDDLGVELELEVGFGLGQRQVCVDGTGTKAIGDLVCQINIREA